MREEEEVGEEGWGSRGHLVESMQSLKISKNPSRAKAAAREGRPPKPWKNLKKNKIYLKCTI